jgi:hypothetical protein
MKTKKLYTCKTNWGWETYPTNAGQIEFYTSAKALKRDKSCARDCGIVEVSATFSKIVQKPSKRPKLVSFEEAQKREKITVPLAKKLVKLAEKAGDLSLMIETAQRALAELKGRRKLK